MNNIKHSIYRILRKSENYTKTDMVVLAKESTWLTFGKIFSTVSAIFLTYIMANFLPQDIFGQYKFIISLFGIITAFSLTGISTSLIQSIAKGYEGTFFQSIKIHLKWSLIMTFLSIAISIYYFLKGNEILGISMIIISIAAPIMQTYTMYASYLQGKRNFRDDSWYSFWYSIIPTLILTITVFLSDSLLLIIMTYFSSYSLVTLFIHKKVSKKINKESEIDPDSIKYGKHLSLMNVLGGISTHIDKILLFHYLGAIQLAIYTMALAIPQQLRITERLVSSISAARLPNLTINQIKKVLPRKIILIFLISLLSFVLYFLLAPLIFHIFFPQYEESVFYTQIYAIIMLFSPLTLIKQVLTSKLKTKELYILQTAMPLVKISGLFILLPIFGIIGAIFSIFLSEIIRTILMIFFYKKLS